MNFTDCFKFLLILAINIVSVISPCNLFVCWCNISSSKLNFPVQVHYTKTYDAVFTCRDRNYYIKGDSFIKCDLHTGNLLKTNIPTCVPIPSTSHSPSVCSNTTGTPSINASLCGVTNSSVDSFMNRTTDGLLGTETQCIPEDYCFAGILFGVVMGILAALLMIALVALIVYAYRLRTRLKESMKEVEDAFYEYPTFEEVHRRMAPRNSTPSTHSGEREVSEINEYYETSKEIQKPRPI